MAHVRKILTGWVSWCMAARSAPGTAETMASRGVAAASLAVRSISGMEGGEGALAVGLAEGDEADRRRDEVRGEGVEVEGGDALGREGQGAGGAAHGHGQGRGGKVFAGQGVDGLGEGAALVVGLGPALLRGGERAGGGGEVGEVRLGVHGAGQEDRVGAAGAVGEDVGQPVLAGSRRPSPALPRWPIRGRGNRRSRPPGRRGRATGRGSGGRRRTRMVPVWKAYGCHTYAVRARFSRDGGGRVHGRENARGRGRRSGRARRRRLRGRRGR